jgi:hypothetical protein
MEVFSMAEMVHQLPHNKKDSSSFSVKKDKCCETTLLKLKTLILIKRFYELRTRPQYHPSPGQ